MNKLLPVFAALLIALFALACGGEDTAEKPAEEMAEKAETMGATGAYTAMDVTNGGTINGTVTFGGTIPEMVKLEVTKDVNVCGKKEHYKKDLVVSEANKGLANVVVSLKDITQGKGMAAMGESFELDQNGCEFMPHITLVPAGMELTILNSDGILHNIHTYSEKNEPINIAQPGFKKRITHTFNKPEVVRVTCDVHNWMSAYIAVTEHPYYAVTDESGSFELTDVPPGTYTLEYWQETLGKQSKEVTVTEGGMVEANLEYAPASARTTEQTQFASLN